MFSSNYDYLAWFAIILRCAIFGLMTAFWPILVAIRSRIPVGSTFRREVSSSLP